MVTSSPCDTWTQHRPRFVTKVTGRSSFFFTTANALLSMAISANGSMLPTTPTVARSGLRIVPDASVHLRGIGARSGLSLTALSHELTEAPDLSPGL